MGKPVGQVPLLAQGGNDPTRRLARRLSCDDCQRVFDALVRIARHEVLSDMAGDADRRQPGVQIRVTATSGMFATARRGGATIRRRLRIARVVVINLEPIGIDIAGRHDDIGEIPTITGRGQAIVSFGGRLGGARARVRSMLLFNIPMSMHGVSQLTVSRVLGHGLARRG